MSPDAAPAAHAPRLVCPSEKIVISAPEPPAAGRAMRAWARDRLGWDDLAHIAANKRVPFIDIRSFTTLGMALFLPVRSPPGSSCSLYRRAGGGLREASST